MSTIYFYRETGPYGFLSNWAHSPFKITYSNKDIRSFHNMEQYIMYMKALLFHDFEMASHIYETSNPKTVKALGRKVRNFKEEIWNLHLNVIIDNGLEAKFTQNQSMYIQLLSGECRTATQFAEASPYDRKWGIGISISKAKSGTPWRGSNLLGKAILRVRDKLVNQLIH